MAAPGDGSASPEGPTPGVTVDRQSCMGSGNCAYWAPDVFDLDDDGIAIVIGDPAAHRDAVRSAAENCPTSAIHLDGASRS